MNASDLVKLECRREAVAALAARLDRFGAVKGEPDWLVSAAWLCTGELGFLASSSTKVMPDGFIARPLAIEEAGQFEQRLETELPDISARLLGRRTDIDLPEPGRPELPADLDRCPAGAYSMKILVRVSVRAAAVHRIACGLLFDFEAGSSLLVGTDIGTLAMVISKDRALIDRYLAGCELIGAEEYLTACDC